MRRLLRPASCLALALLLAGCGFQPRGQLRLPEGMPALAVQAADPYSLLAEDLQRALRQGGVTVAEVAPGTATLVLESEAWSERPLSVDSFVTVREVEILYDVTFRLDDAQGQPLLTAQSLSLGRDYVYEAQQAFGVPGEQELLRQELRQEMTAAVLRRVDLALRRR
jgi:LPS-assembly lipoprotein